MNCELLKVVTTGDRKLEWSLEKQGGKGLFTAELEQALLRGEAQTGRSIQQWNSAIPDESILLFRCSPRWSIVPCHGMFFCNAKDLMRRF